MSIKKKKKKKNKRKKCLLNVHSVHYDSSKWKTKRVYLKRAVFSWPLLPWLCLPWELCLTFQLPSFFPSVCVCVCMCVCVHMCEVIDIHHISLRCIAWWFDFPILWNNYHNRFSLHPSSHAVKNKTTFSLWWELSLSSLIPSPYFIFLLFLFYF